MPSYTVALKVAGFDTYYVQLPILYYLSFEDKNTLTCRVMVNTSSAATHTVEFFKFSETVTCIKFV